VEAFITCAEGTPFKLQSLDKVRMGVALSVLNEEDPRLGPATRGGLIKLNSSVFYELREFFSRMKPMPS